MSETLESVTAVEPGQRRHFTAEQKRALLDEARRPGQTMSGVARRYGVAPSLLFHWKRVMDDASSKGLKANEQGIPLSEVKKLRARIRELERALGKKSLQVDLLEEAVEIAREKKWISRGNLSSEGEGQ